MNPQYKSLLLLKLHNHTPAFLIRKKMHLLRKNSYLATERKIKQKSQNCTCNAMQNISHMHV